MERWSGVLRVSFNRRNKTSSSYVRVAASLCFSSSSKTLTSPSANAVFFNGDRVQGTGNPVIEKLSDCRNIAEILVSKLGASVNAWVIEASVFNGPFAVYQEFIPSVNSWGEPKSYKPNGFPASTSIASIVSKFLEEAKKVIQSGQQEPSPANMHYVASEPCPNQPKTIIIGFSKGGTVLNQLLSELAHLKHEPARIWEENAIFPSSENSLLRSISDFHYVDVGLNSKEAYLTDANVIKKISEHLSRGTDGMRFVLHGTPRQWCDSSRPWIRNEKDRLLQLLEEEAHRSGGKLQVHERFYFPDRPPNLQMHFEIIENLDMS
ncbi:uncharacterized protein LOC131232446 isoform X2 [Magnolia sinica]|uniref:uncharacterized protein LOC131232446 isoform X2 n=1 Tax=Magnolia sinica TaxID=86752 RepID=UPI00265B1A13|nr:uncharacterized protein LOC131232446 isoform X2 [Magnolia sinica]